MKTYFLGTEQLRAYLRDFLDRLEKADSFPSVWCALTESGEELLKALIDLVNREHPHLLRKKIRVLRIDVGKGSRKIRFCGGNPSTALRGKSVLVLDGAIHSGLMMSTCVDEILKHRPADVCSYALFVKRGSAFIPTLWGVMIDDVDRAFFLLTKIPNNRLNTEKRPQPAVHIRRLNENHVGMPKIVSGIGSIDRATWSDRLFQMQSTHERVCTYVLEKAGRIRGFLTIQSVEPNIVSIDEIVVDPKTRSQGFGAILMRFAHSLARHSDCKVVRLNALKERIPFYRKHGYRDSPGVGVRRLDEEEYQPMEHGVIHHDRFLS